ncbi:MAG: hypothetical protein A2W85_05270 [Bacteroidetes bacterium GWF2_41_31]|nr:MAG: hypothetical protein A2W85_05270 [Bacteroidetes bacterium GWF2_41_31]OFZ02742.1 MAG: hypothetical protein A2338_04860 [Bacteroidetes bacterium RIFOXYB12_FULL_41_6]
MKILFTFIVIFHITGSIYSQGVGISSDGSTPDPSSILDVSSTSKGILPPRMLEIERIAITDPAVGLLVYQMNNTPGYYYYDGTNWLMISSSTNSSVHYIGEVFGGGIVFYVYDGGHHGLIAALVDQSSGIQWDNATFSITNAVRWGINSGKYNTERIISNEGVGNYAASVCANFIDGGFGFGDWYLPSFSELQKLYLQKTLVGCSASLYWSSLEDDANNAWYFNFDNQTSGATNKSSPLAVRAIRSF